MPSLVEAIHELEADLGARPMRIAAHSDMPFAVFCYPPREEFEVRKHLRLLTISLQQKYGRRVTFISLARLVWEITREFGIEDLFKTESLRGFEAGQRHVHQLLTSPDFRPIHEAVLEKLETLKPETDIAFLIRAGGFSPTIFRASPLLEGLHRQTMVPTILFYPGHAEGGADLRFYDLPRQENLGTPAYRVRIYGAKT